VIRLSSFYSSTPPLTLQQIRQVPVQPAVQVDAVFRMATGEPSHIFVLYCNRIPLTLPIYLSAAAAEYLPLYQRCTAPITPPHPVVPNLRPAAAVYEYDIDNVDKVRILLLSCTTMRASSTGFGTGSGGSAVR
jgi:hypothetical protein